MQTHDCIMFTNFLQNILHLYRLYYIHSKGLMTNYCRLIPSQKYVEPFNEVYIKHTAGYFSLLIMIAFKIQSLEALEGVLPGFHSLY